MARIIWINATGQTFTGAGLISGVIVGSHSSGTLKLNDQPQAGNLGALILDTYTFPTGSGVVSFPGKGIQFQDGVFATLGGTGSVGLVISLDTSGVLA